MYPIMVAGAGKIGSLIACLLAESKDYEVHLADISFAGSDAARLLKTKLAIKTVALNVQDEEATTHYLKNNQIKAIVSSLPFFLNPAMARAAKAAQSHYFDLTEDVAVTEEIKALAKDAATLFVPQCGLAPGFIGIVAHSLISAFDSCEQARLRVGALPERSSNALHYALTWSTEGLINEYGNPCFAIESGKIVQTKALEGLESIQIEGSTYEAFNTSGGLGNLASLYEKKIKILNYKTLRYPGHCEKIRFLMNDLKLNEDRQTLKRILENTVPKTYQDMVLIYVSAEGTCNGFLCEKSYWKKLRPRKLQGMEWSAIQTGTASGVCAVLDVLLQQKELPKGFFMQETLPLEALLTNRFGQYFQTSSAAF